MTDVPHSFMSRDFQRVRPDDEDLKLRAESAIQLPVSLSPMPHQLDASSLIFGTSTSYGRLTYADNSLVHDWARWLTDGRGRSNGATLFLALQQADGEEQVARTRSILQQLGIHAVVLLANDNLDVTSRYTKLLRHMVSRGADNDGNNNPSDAASSSGGRAGKKKFFALIDDDAFFPSLGRLLGHLDRIDADEPVYLGLPSERGDWTVEDNIITTYGGGAVFFTTPMAEKVARLPCSPGSSSSSSSNGVESRSSEDNDDGSAYWDELLYRCVARHTKDRLHVLPSLYTPAEEEVDVAVNEENYAVLAADLLRRPPAGYASGDAPLALHHSGPRHRLAAGRAHAVASACGEACFLQRFRFRDDWVLVNGHSLSHYPDGLEVLPQRESAAMMEAQRLEREMKKAEEASGKKKNTSHTKKIKTDPRLIIEQEFSAYEDANGGRWGSLEEEEDERKVISWTGVKRTWRLLDARSVDVSAKEEVSSGEQPQQQEIWQAYVRRRGEPVSYGEEDDVLPGDTVHTQEGPSDVDSVIVLIWEP